MLKQNYGVTLTLEYIAAFYMYSEQSHKICVVKTDMFWANQRYRTFNTGWVPPLTLVSGLKGP